MIQQSPARLEALARIMHKKMLKGKKANTVICGFKNYGWSKAVVCNECNRVCYYSPNECLDLKIKNPKKICPACALQNHKDTLNEEHIKILKKITMEYEKSKA